jgi:hypothetical protein
MIESTVGRKRIAILTPFAFKPASPPIPYSGETTVAVGFSFTTPSPMVLGVIAAGSRFSRVALLIDQAFDGVGATISFGTSGDLGLLLKASDCRAMPGQYDSNALVVIGVADVLLLSLHTVGSTQGAGVLLYKVLPP